MFGFHIGPENCNVAEHLAKLAIMIVHVEVRFFANQILSSFSCIALHIFGEPVNHCMKERMDGKPVKVAADPRVLAPMTDVCGDPYAPYLWE